MSTYELTHDEALAALDALALDALETVERDAVLAHVAWCTECREELKVLRATASHVAYAAPVPHGGLTSARRDRIRARLGARAAVDLTSRDLRKTPTGTTPSRPSAAVPARPTVRRSVFAHPIATSIAPPRHAPISVNATESSITNVMAWRRAEWIAAAASVLLVVTVSLLAFTFRDRQNVKAALQAQVTFDEQTRSWGDSLKGVVASRDSMINGLIGRDVAIMRLTSAGAHSPFAMMFWDKAHNTWTLSAHNMPELKPGRTYQLWLVTSTAKISAGTFDPKNGDAVVRATYPLTGDVLRALAVTEEQSGGAAQPTTTPIIAVSAQ
ncbi:MAG: anti-sigma factor [Gemmatimonadaceae bacterium]